MVSNTPQSARPLALSTFFSKPALWIHLHGLLRSEGRREGREVGDGEWIDEVRVAGGCDLQQAERREIEGGLDIQGQHLVILKFLAEAAQGHWRINPVDLVAGREDFGGH